MLQYTQITNLISELLYKHDCVIVPSFGGFVARNHSSNFSKGNNLLYPQAKHILFNRNLVHNDGLLISSLMEKAGITYNEAEKLVVDYKDYIQSLLSAKKRFELSNIGLLYIDNENNLRFEAKTDVNFLLESFGFEPVIANELVLEVEKPIIEKQFEDRKAIVVVPEKRRRSYVKIAAMAVGIPATFALLLLAASSKPMQPLLKSSLNPFYTPEQTYTPAKETGRKAFFIQKAETENLLADAHGYASFTISENGNVLVANINDSISKADKTAVHKPVHVKHNNNSFDGHFQVVLGCFGIEENAVKLVHELMAKHIDAGISGTNSKGLHIVSCGGFSSKEEATTLLSTIKMDYPNAWVMIK